MTAGPRVALFADSFLEVNGVALTCRNLAAYSGRRELSMLVVHPGKATGLEREGSLWRLSLACSPVHLRLERDLRFDLLFARQLRLVRRTLQEFGAELVHLTGPNHTGFLGALAAWRGKLPVVMSWHTDVHEYAAWRLPHPAPQWLRSAVREASWHGLALYYRQARLILAPNPRIGSALERATGKPFRLMLRGVDTGLFHPAKRERRDAGLRVGYVGRLSPEKAVRRLRDVALALEAARIGDFRIDIIGDGAEREWLRENVPRAHLHGVLRGEALARAYASLDLFVFPSETDTFGNVVQEAMASGVPCLVMEAGGPATIVSDGVTGRICRSTEELAAAAVELAQRPELRRRLGEAARRAAEKRTWAAMGEAVWSAYGEAISRPAQQRAEPCCVA